MVSRNARMAKRLDYQEFVCVQEEEKFLKSKITGKILKEENIQELLNTKISPFFLSCHLAEHLGK